MGILSGTTGAKTSKPPVYTCLQIQTSAQGLPIPIIWGAQRISGNCIDYFNFQSSGSKKGSSGKGGKGNGDTYTAAVVIALCEGSADSHPSAVGRMWSGVSETTLEGYGGGIFAGSSDQAPWSSAAAIGHDVGYSYTCYYANYEMQLGASASLPNLNFEMFSTFNGHNVDNANTGLPDANFGDIIPDFLTNTRYGLNLSPLLLSGFNDDGLTSNTSLLVYNLAAGIYVSPLLKDAEQVTTILKRWANIANAWIYWNGTQIVCVCLGDTPITAHGVSYIPNVTPIYDLGPDDFQVVDKNGKDAKPPIKVTRKDPDDGFNQVQLNASIRTTNGGVANSPAYQDTPFRWQDDGSIGRVGVKAPNTISSTEVCNVNTAAVVVSLIGQRTQYIRNQYSFNLLYYFLLLLPGDIVTLTDPNIGLNKVPVRIMTIDEDDKGALAFVAEEFALGVGTANIQEFEPGGALNPFNPLTPPGPINPPAFLQPDPSLTGGQSEIWIALSGGANVGGCGVYISFDDVTFTDIGQVTTQSLQGTLTAALPLASGLDTTNTLAIDLTECLGVIPATATEADAQAYRTLCMVDDELLAYGSVSPTGEYSANLTYLERGLYGTAPALHEPGAPFARIDSTKVFQYLLPAQYVGTTLYFQFPTVNAFGNVPQTLADCVTYTFTPDTLPTPLGLTIGYVYTAGELTGLQCSWTNPSGPTPQNFAFQYSTEPAGTPDRIVTAFGEIAGGVSSALLSLPEGFNASETLYWDIQAVSNGAESAWSADAFSPAPVISAATNVYNPDGSYGGLLVQWSQPSGPAPTSFVVAWNLGGGLGGQTTAPAGATQILIPASTVQQGSADAVALSATMQAVFGQLYSPISASATATGSPSFPLLLTALSASAIGGGSVLLSWEPQTSGPQPTFYRAFYWSGGPPTYELFKQQDFAAPASSGTIMGLTAGEGVTFCVVTYNAAGTAEVFEPAPNNQPENSPQQTVTVS